MNDIKQKIESTYKSLDTEEWIDRHFTRPIGYLWALFFRRLHVHPNAVTIMSILLGMGAAWMFYYRDLVHNLVGVLLLMWANFYDSCDGQLARMTGQKTRWGRMLDGLAGDIWFFCIYVALCLRLQGQDIPLTHHPWGPWIYIVAIVCGLFFHSRQARLADYYRNIHLFFLSNTGHELDRSARQQALLCEARKKRDFWWSVFLWFYVRYTRAQERSTPHAQALLHHVIDERNSQIPDALRQDFRRGSLPLVKIANVLTFNCRALVLYASCLLDIPWVYFLVELIPFTLLAQLMHRRHEALCIRILESYNHRNGNYKNHPLPQP